MVIDALLNEGATPDEIEKIVLNEKMNNVLLNSQEVHNLYGKGSIAVVVGNPSKEEFDTQVFAQEQLYYRGYLEASLDLFASGAVALDEFATENPRLAQLSLAALDAVFSGPARFVVSYCCRELGVEDKVDACKDKIHGWLSGKISDITYLSPEMSSVLISGGEFGAGFAFYALKLQGKDKILQDAKKVGVAAKKIPHSSKQTRILTDAERKGFKGGRGFELKNPHYQARQNVSQVINGRQYSGHAIDQMRNRGIYASVVENAIKTGQRFQSNTNPTCWEFKDLLNNIKVVVDKTTGNVVTIIPKI
jgi:filamentous hemagglutinin